MTSRLLPPLLLGLVHGLVDAACAFVLFRDLALSPVSDVTFSVWVALYDVLAFVGQVPLGLMTDRLGARRSSALCGVVLVAAAVLIAPAVPMVAAVVAGLGNALYHVGGGAHILATSGGRAAEIGVFVGPGSVGLALGITAGHSDLRLRVPMLLALAIGGWLVGRIVVDASETSPRSSGRGLSPLGHFALGLVLLAVASRALLGDALVAEARLHSPGLVLGLAFAACFGKGMGGLIGDRFGWGTTAAIALGSAALLLAAAPNAALAVMAAACLGQMTMPLTLKAVHDALVARPAFAFGLASAVLLVGTAPGLAGLRILETSLAMAAVALASALPLVVGLGLLARSRLHRSVADDPARREDGPHRADPGRDEFGSPAT